MDKYESLVAEAADRGIDAIEKKLSGRIKGLYCDNTIAISSTIDTIAEKACIISEELGHYETSAGDIIDLKDTRNRKQERRARIYAYQKMLPLDRLIEASSRAANMYELAKELDVTEEFLNEAIKTYKQRYGICVTRGDYTIYFEPALGIMKRI